MNIIGVFIALNHATLVRKANQDGDRKYHDYADLPCMVLPPSTLQRVANIMKNTIDDADDMINRIVFILYNQ